MSVFQRPRPTRIRIDSERPIDCVDVTVPCYVALFPTDAGEVAFRASYANGAELAELTAALIRLATTVGVMQNVLTILTTSPTNMQARASGPAKPGEIPPDDLPPHLRK